MARAFSKSFYNSKLWKECRKGYVANVNGMCERCSKKGLFNPGVELHHKIYLTPDNINDPYITLNWDNLELLCASCHSVEHMSKYSSTREDVMFNEIGELIQSEQR